MKKSAYAFAAIACFVGVMGALQADRWLESRKVSDSVDRVFKASTGINVIPTSAEKLPAGAIDFRIAARKVTPAVVSVDRYQDVPIGFFEDRVVRQETGTGSGVILSKDGLIVTNNHVVDRAQEVKVRLSDKRVFTAKVLGVDPRSDLAVLRINGTNLTPIEVGTSTNLEVGQWVMAVGNPLGFDSSLSVGVVSSLGRTLPVGDQGLVDGIQTDAAINPGNSGGALCDSEGRLIGINTAIASNTGQSVGIGFAVPADRVKKIVSDIVKFGEAKYAGLGIGYDPVLASNMDNPRARRMIAERVTNRDDFPNTGILVLSSSAGATKAGIKRGAVILEVDGEKLDSTVALNKVLVNKKPGDTVTIKYWQDGETKSGKITLVEIASRV